MALPELTVVVVAFGSEALLDDCLRPVAGHFDVVVVDNASRDECRAICDQHEVHYVDAGRNAGFAGGVNIGLTFAKGDVLLLNPDAQLSVRAIDELRARVHGGSTLACVAPAQSHPTSGAAQRVQWPLPSPGRQWLIALGLGRLTGRHEFLIGSALMIKRDALLDVGPFDERYFLYCEETDWQRRARERGWHVELIREVKARHVGAGTSTDSSMREAFFHAGQEIYIRKWFGTGGWRAYRAACLVGDLLRVATGGERARAARSRLSIYREGPVHHRDRLLAERTR